MCLTPMEVARLCLENSQQPYQINPEQSRQILTTHPYQMEQIQLRQQPSVIPTHPYRTNNYYVSSESHMMAPQVQQYNPDMATMSQPQQQPMIYPTAQHERLYTSYQHQIVNVNSFPATQNNPEEEQKKDTTQPVENSSNHPANSFVPVTSSQSVTMSAQESHNQKFEDITDDDEIDNGGDDDKDEKMKKIADTDDDLIDEEETSDDREADQKCSDEEELETDQEDEQTDQYKTLSVMKMFKNEAIERDTIKKKDADYTAEDSETEEEADEDEEDEKKSNVTMETNNETSSVNRRNLRKRTPRRLTEAAEQSENETEDKKIPSKKEKLPQKRGRKKKLKTEPRLSEQHYKWDNQAMLQAIKAVCSGNIKIHLAAKKYNVPASTLRDRVRGRVKHGCRPGPGPLLTSSEETELVTFLLDMKKKGFGIVGRDIQVQAKDMLSKRNHKLKCADGMPSGTWLKGFRARHKKLDAHIKTRDELVAAKIPLIHPEYAAELAEKRKSSRSTYHLWNDNDMQRAIDDVRNNGLAVQESARKYKVPSSTLRDRLSGKVRNAKPGPKRLLTDEEEQEVISFCLSMQKRGYGLTRTDFLLKSTEILQRPNREKKYNKGIPDHNWWLNFKKRHPEVTHHVQHRSYWKAHGVPLLSESKDPAQDEAKVTKTNGDETVSSYQVQPSQSGASISACQVAAQSTQGNGQSQNWNIVAPSMNQYGQVLNPMPGCVMCRGAHLFENCLFHNPTHIIKDNQQNFNCKTSVFASLPPEIFMTSIPSHGLSMFALKYIKALTQLGPIKGRVTKLSDLNVDVDERYVWYLKKDENGESCYIVAEDESHSNWLRYVRPGGVNGQSCNLQPVWKPDGLYFVTNRDIYPGEELYYAPIMYEIPCMQSEQSELVCGFCERQFLHPLYLHRHIFLVHSSRPKPQISNQSDSVDNTANGEETVTSDPLSLQAVLDKNKIECDICGKFYITKSSLSYHKRIVHSTSSVSCETCNKVFKSIFLYRKHVKTTHTKEYYRKCCDRCGKKFPDVFQLKVHLLTHSGVRPYQCSMDACSQSFRTKQCIQIHYRKVHGFENHNMPKIARSVPLTFESMSGGMMSNGAQNQSLQQL